MIAEVLLLLAGHESSLFQDVTVNPSFSPLLHPGEQQTLESIAQIAVRYRRVRSFCISALQFPNRYICALCSTILSILRAEYESLIVETEAKILRRDDTFVGQSSFVPISAVRATFAEWDAPLKALDSFITQIEDKHEWLPGPLIDILLERANSGVHTVASVFSRISIAVQRTWLGDLSALLIHGNVSDYLPLAAEKVSSSKTASSTYELLDGSTPSCVSPSTRESITYIGRAVATVANTRNSKQFPRSMAIEHSHLLDEAFPQDTHHFDHVIDTIRRNVSEWLWLNVLTKEDVQDAVHSLANYFLLRNGEFSLALIREFERLKISRLTLNLASRQSPMIREQDLHLAMLRASLGTSAQTDPTLARLRFVLPGGPLRPLLPSLQPLETAPNSRPSTFSDMLLGTELKLTYNLPWPLDLFLTQGALSSYNLLFAFLSSVRKTHVRVLDTWVSLSNSQRVRRRWTGTGEGGTEDRAARERLLRCGWGCARTMNWFLEILMEYVWNDVVDEEFSKLQKQLGIDYAKASGTEGSQNTEQPRPLDFSTLRLLHNIYLNNLYNNTLLAHSVIASTIRSILETCEQFVAQIERWGGDVLPPLLFEGSLSGTGSRVGDMVRERSKIIRNINEKLSELLETFYEQLSAMISQPFAYAGDNSARSFIMNTSITFQSFTQPKAAKTEISDRAGDTRRHIERLLLRLDFSSNFSKPSIKSDEDEGKGDILRQGGLA
ncbi:hypothetical protein M422DRAFT_46712 [Sphaerobolus stellatus SS14]|uniref:Spindle pole body component n=1 Tax=Sphaerobolus stellatus (strain SS14) TaxID=990650 RepID=A0A0C9US37_SPHS4|nr:hypothetical protein M422DRAFT_46712 [Sphaerobolus stellatus SS14]